MKRTRARAYYATNAIVTPRGLAEHLFSADDENAYHRAIRQIGRDVRGGLLRKVTAGVYQRNQQEEPKLPRQCTLAQAAMVLYGDSSKREAARQALLRAGAKRIGWGVYAIDS